MAENNQFNDNYFLKYLSIEGEERYLALEVLRTLEGYCHLYPRADMSAVTKPFEYLLSAVRSLQDLSDDGSRYANETPTSKLMFEPEEFTEMLSLAQEEALDERESFIYTSRYGVNENAKTLAEIGRELGISRERIRQILDKSNRKILIKGKKQASSGNFDSACAILIYGLNKHIIPDGEGAIERILNFIELNLAHLSVNQALTLICYFLFQKDELTSRYKRLALEAFDQRVKLRNENLKIEAKRQSLVEKFDRLLCNVIWPKELSHMSKNDLASLKRARNINEGGDGNTGSFFSEKLKREVQYESNLELNFLNMLEASNEVIFYQEQPLKITYSHGEVVKNYYPDIFFVLKNNQCVIAEVKPYFQMALQINLNKWSALKAYCKENGYGMLVTDGNRCIQQITRHIVSPFISERILSTLTAQNLSWAEYKKIRDELKIGYLDFLALVLTEKLIWQLSPFKLSKFNS